MSGSSDNPHHPPEAVALMDRITSKQATVGVIGLGYVGLPLVKTLLEHGFKVVGFDVDRTKIERLDAGHAYIEHLGQGFFDTLRDSEEFQGTGDPSELARADAILICVPTPLGRHNDPDLSYIRECTRMISGVLRPGQLVALESTTYPGTTRDELKPILDESGLECGREYFLAYSPEREDPGNAGRRAGDLPKVVGGVDEVSTDLAMALYRQVVAEAHRVSSAEVAESAKLLENIYRSVNIALVNEMKGVLDDLDIDIWEVIEAASTKPFGFQPFFPGPGLGGHCIPIDPFYLTWKAKEVGRNTRFIELAGQINTSMPKYVVQRVHRALDESGVPASRARVLILGIAYKRNVDDCRETPAAEIISQLTRLGCEVRYHDPHLSEFPRMRRYRFELASVPLDAAVLEESDCVLVVTDHDDVDYELVARHAGLVVDTRNAMARVPAEGLKCRVVKA